MGNLTKPTSINAIYKDIKSQGLKVSKDDLYLWANYLCDIFMFMRIPRYSRSLVKEQQSQDKYYCIDIGLREAVLIPQSNDYGKSLENIVFLQLIRTKAPLDKITYYQGGGECDFVIQHADSVKQLIQVAWEINDPNTREREIAGILEASQETGCDNLFIITKDAESVVTHDGKQINIVPAWKWLLI